MQTSNGRSVMVVGRIVWASGDLFKGKQKVDFNTKAPKLNAQGQPMMEYGFGLAIPKTDVATMWAAIHEEAYTLYPSRQIPPSFAMKYKDGDGIDDKGISFAQRKGYAGNLVFACTTTISPLFFRLENGINVRINEGIKCGDYVEAQINIKAHPAVGQGRAGLYLNPLAVRFLAYGEEIVNAPSGDAIFGTTQAAIPQGASATPMGSSVPMPTAAPVQPNWGVVPAAHQPVSQTAAPAMPQFPTMPR